jgi:uncharacterized protein (DUF2225 family)
MAIDVAEVKRRLQTLLNDPNLVNEYVRQYGPAIDIKNIKALKESRQRVQTSGEEKTPGEDPIFELKVRCPVCNQDEIVCYEIRAKSQQILQNKFLVPTYAGAFGYKTVDYTMLAVTICPRCLFASPDKKDFNRPASQGLPETKTQLIGNVIMTLQEKIGERKAILKSVSDYGAYFKRPRFDDAAIDSYKLAIARAKVEAWYEQPYSYYKLGAYALRIAKIIKDSGGDNREVLREAQNYLEEAFRTSNCPSEEIEMQVIYTVVALYIKLSDFKRANSYIGVFNNLKNTRQAEMRTNPKLNTVTIEKWADKAKYLWEERDNADYLKDE